MSDKKKATTGAISGPNHWLEIKARQLAGGNALNDGTRSCMQHVLDELDKERELQNDLLAIIECLLRKKGDGCDHLSNLKP